MDEFEKRLKRLRLKDPPAALDEAILGAIEHGARAGSRTGNRTGRRIPLWAAIAAAAAAALAGLLTGLAIRPEPAPQAAPARIDVELSADALAFDFTTPTDFLPPGGVSAGVRQAPGGVR